MKDLIQTNFLSRLHNGKDIFFCKTDYLVKDFDRISKLDNEVILISGNSDYGITDTLVSQSPKNIKKWFCVNRTSYNDKLVTIPLGIENYSVCRRDGHGYVWPHVHEKVRLLSQEYDVKPQEFIYSNFTVGTNVLHRSRVRQIAIGSSHINHEDPNKSDYSNYIKQILNHEAVVCPQGNGGVPEGDNHRIYEVLYCGRIPLTFAKDYYKKIHHKFPVVLLDDPSELEDEKYLREKINEVKSKSFDEKYLTNKYWESLILKESESL